MAQGSAMSRVMDRINRTTGIRDSGSRKGNAASNQKQSIIRELRDTRNLPDTIYNYRGNMNARARRDYVSRLIGRTLNSRTHVSITRNKNLDRSTSRDGVRRTLEGYRISYSYS